LFPRKCTYAKVIDLRNMVLWSIGLIANQYRIPPTKLACVRFWQPRVSGEKSGLRDVKRADFLRYWWRSGLKHPDKPKIFIKKNVRNHSYHQFYPVLARRFGLTEVYCSCTSYKWKSSL